MWEGDVKMAKKFLRRVWSRYAKLGKGRKKKQKWKKPTGRDNKMREKRKGYPAVVSLGYKKKKENMGKIQDKIPVLINTFKDLNKINAKNIAIIGNIGKKKKIEIAKKIKEKNIQVYNMNPQLF